MEPTAPKARSVQILTLANPDERRAWDRLVESASLPDIYYRPAYVGAYEEAGHGQAVAFLIQAGQLRVLLPLLLRPLHYLPFQHPFDGYDAVTPYGYGGLLPLSEPQCAEAAEIVELLATLQETLRGARIVSCLLRLHPLLHQDTWLEPGLCVPGVGLRQFGPTTAIALSDWNSATACISTMAKGRRSDLSLARRTLTVTWTSGCESVGQDGLNVSKALEVFYDLYEARMCQLDAKSFYHFPRRYYTALVRGLRQKLAIGIAWAEREPVGAALFMADALFAHYHLSAANDHGRTLKAATIIINQAAAWARDRGCRWLHLGGGASGSGDDSLLRFKKSFTRETFTYSFLTIVGDAPRYEALAELRFGLPGAAQPSPGFFPVYRA